MTQGNLLDLPATRAKVQRPVRATSRAAYADGLARFTGRKAAVLGALTAYWDTQTTWPTSAELAYGQDWGASWDGAVLFARRGLSDLQAAGVVQAVPNGQRTCRVGGTRCETWRVVPR